MNECWQCILLIIFFDSIDAFFISYWFLINLQFDSFNTWYVNWFFVFDCFFNFLLEILYPGSLWFIDDVKCVENIWNVFNWRVESKPMADPDQVHNLLFGLVNQANLR